MTAFPAHRLRVEARSGKTGAVLSRSDNESRAPVARPLRFRKAVLTLSALLAAGACGPSVQSIYEGNVRFEHCYKLDLEVDSAPTHREACWKEWLGMYTYGQPRDRIEYARRRLHAFNGGDTSRPRLEISEQKAPEAARQFYLVTPAPTSGHASPQPVATPYYADAGVAPPAVSREPVTAPEDDCTKACRDALSECQAPCDGPAAPGAKCKSCEANYKTCMKRCFK